MKLGMLALYTFIGYHMIDIMSLITIIDDFSV